MAGLHELMDRVRGCFARIEPWVQAREYVRAVSADLPERNGWTIAEWIGDRTPDKTQRLLNRAVWDTDQVMSHLRRYAVAGLDAAAGQAGHGELLRIGALDETGQEKKGQATAGVKRQHMGCAGGVDNGINTVHLAYVRQRVGHTLIGCRQWIPAEQVADPDVAARMGLPAGAVFATKGQLAVRLLADAADDGVSMDFVAGDEVYGHNPDLRSHCETTGQGYVLRVRSTFTVTLGDGSGRACKQIVGSMLWTHQRWQIVSAGPGDKGARDYAWAWVATASPVHWLLVRKHLRTGELAFHYCHVPAGRPVSLHLLVAAAGLRWPVEESFEFGKDLFGLDQSQVRRYEAIRRHTVLVMLALAVYAVAAAEARPRTDTQAPPPTGPDAPPPTDPGHTPLSIAALKNLVNALHPRHHGIDHTIHWQNWRDRHRARARWHHQRTRLRRPIQHAYPQLT